MFKQAFGLRKPPAASVNQVPKLTLNDEDIPSGSPRSRPQDKVNFTGIPDPSGHSTNRGAENTAEVLNTQKNIDKSGLFILLSADLLFLRKHVMFSSVALALRILKTNVLWSLRIAPQGDTKQTADLPPRPLQLLSKRQNSHRRKLIRSMTVFGASMKVPKS